MGLGGTCSVPQCIFNYAICVFIAIGYIGSLYIWKMDKNEVRHSPAVLKKRFISVIGVTLISPGLVKQFMEGYLLHDHSLWHVLGFRSSGLLAASTIPLVLTSVLFLGPILTNLLTSHWSVEDFSLHDFGLMEVRTYLVAPITEEIVFRACMIALVIHCTSPTYAILICPMFFGAAHMHKIYEEVSRGVPLKHACKVSALQFAYTSVFGAYSAYLFIRSGHVAAPIVVHIFCNFMGFPDMSALAEIPPPARTLVKLSYLAGVIAWAYLLPSLTAPTLYNNDLPWVTRL